MRDDEAFSEWLEKSNHDAEFISQIRLMMEQRNNLIQSISEVNQLLKKHNWALAELECEKALAGI